jgi:hypothetical protein
MATIAAMVYDIQANTTSLVQSVAEGKNAIENIDQSMVKNIATGVALGEMFTKVAELGVTAFEKIADAIPAVIEHTIAVGNSLYEMSLKTGASVENLSALRYVASQTGIDFDSFGTTLVKMEQALGSTGAKADALQGQLDNLGLNLQTLKNEKPDEAFIDIMSALEEMPNRADQAAIGMAVFGKGFKEMAGLTQESITELIQKARDLGLIVSTETAAAAHVAETSWKSLTMQFEALADRLGATVLPGLVALEQLAIDAVRSLSQDSGLFDSLFGPSLEKSITLIGESIIQATAAMAGFAEGSIEGLRSVMDVAIRTGEAIANVGILSIKVSSLGTAGDTGNGLAAQALRGLEGSYQALEMLKSGFHATADVAAKAFAAVEGVADHMAGRFGDAYHKAQQTIQEFANTSHAAFGGIGADLEDADNEAKILNERLKNIAESEALVQGAVKAAMAGPQDVLRTMAMGQGTLSLPGIIFNAPAQDMGKVLIQSMNQAVIAMPDLSGQAKDHMKSVLGSGISDAFTSAFKKFPTLLTDAFTGGGNLKGALSAVGNEISNNLFGEKGALSGVTSKVASTVTGAFSALGGTASKILGGLASSVLPGLGGLLSSAVGMIMGIGGPSKQELAGRQTEADFEKQMGGWQGIQKALLGVGVSADDANAMIQNLWHSETSGSAAVQSSIDAINSKIKSQTDKISAGVDSILTAAQTVGGQAPAALQPLIAKLESMPGITDAEKKSLDALLGNAPSLQNITDTASKYGLTLDSLGSKTQQLSISSQADQLEQDYNTLINSGADVNAVQAGMSKSFGDLVANAEKYGSSLPTALQPVIKTLFDSGNLADSAGHKISDISGLKFDDTNDPLAKGMKNLTDSINNLIKLLGGGVPDAAADAAKGITDHLGNLKIAPINVPLRFTGDGADSNYASRGGLVTSHGIQFFGAGGNVLPFLPRGTDTVPAMLTPGEMVLTKGQQRALFGSGGGSDGATLENTTIIQVDGREFYRLVEKKQTRALQSRRKMSPA